MMYLFQKWVLYPALPKLICFSAGNMVEWCLPQDIDLEGVEFKSMASGSHKIQSDFMWVHLSCITSSFLNCASTPPAIHSEHAREILPRKLGSCRNLLAKLFLPEPKIFFRQFQYHIKYHLAAGICCMTALPVEANWGRPASYWCGNFNFNFNGQMICTTTIETVSRSLGWRASNGRTEMGRILQEQELEKCS